MSDTTHANPENFRQIYPSLFLALVHDYTQSMDWGYVYAVMIGDGQSMRLFRGTGKTKREAIQDAIREYENEFHPQR